ncbi:unnamed protein product [Prorocentrum cordatum]|uniref:Uncharacterized protein n=1 Tax=Prorocentrum cordatum TaxID=2364126 RepID=A0ABN9WPR6_9DINO|nr:unnamed protein product [Polarella glacialis]
MSGVRNPSGVVMSRVRAVADPNDLTAIFIDLNGLDTSCEEKLWALTPDQRAAVIAPGIYVQNVRNPVTAVLSRIQNVLDGAHAIGGKGGRGGAGAAAAAAPWRPVASPSSSSSGSSERRRRRRRRR